MEQVHNRLGKAAIAVEIAFYAAVSVGIATFVILFIRAAQSLDRNRSAHKTPEVPAVNQEDALAKLRRELGSAQAQTFSNSQPQQVVTSQPAYTPNFNTQPVQSVGRAYGGQYTISTGNNYGYLEPITPPERLSINLPPP